jgi:siroheme synthase (precorrin-2 oxidase/ferrochelatase)
MFHSIYPYSRREAIRNGVMIDISDEAKDPDFKIPAAVTYSSLEYLVSSKGLEQGG